MSTPIESPPPTLVESSSEEVEALGGALERMAERRAQAPDPDLPTPIQEPRQPEPVAAAPVAVAEPTTPPAAPDPASEAAIRERILAEQAAAQAATAAVQQQTEEQRTRFAARAAQREELIGPDQEYQRLLRLRGLGEYLEPEEDQRLTRWIGHRDVYEPLVSFAAEDSAGQVEANRQQLLQAIGNAVQAVATRPGVDQQTVMTAPTFDAIFTHVYDAAANAAQAASAAKVSQLEAKLATLEAENRGLRTRAIGQRPTPELGGQILSVPRGPQRRPYQGTPATQLMEEGLREMSPSNRS